MAAVTNSGCQVTAKVPLSKHRYGTGRLSAHAQRYNLHRNTGYNHIHFTYYRFSLAFFFE